MMTSWRQSSLNGLTMLWNKVQDIRIYLAWMRAILNVSESVCKGHIRNESIVREGTMVGKLLNRFSLHEAFILPCVVRAILHKLAHFG